MNKEHTLKAAGYDALTNWLSNDEFKDKSSRDLKNIIKECITFKNDILN